MWDFAMFVGQAWIAWCVATQALRLWQGGVAQGEELPEILLSGFISTFVAILAALVAWTALKTWATIDWPF